MNHLRFLVLGARLALGVLAAGLAACGGSNAPVVQPAAPVTGTAPGAGTATPDTGAQQAVMRCAP